MEFELINQILGIENDGYVAYKTPVGIVFITDANLRHVVENRGDRRERYANFIIPTLVSPTEIWQTAYDDGSYRRRYIKVFKGSKYAIAVIVMKVEGYFLFTNMLPRSLKKMNKLRSGDLIMKNFNECE